jgi:chemotaxis protein methyltransferase CheR
MSATLPVPLLEELSTFVASQLGLHFPQERWEDLSHSMTTAAREQGSGTADAYARGLLSRPLSRTEMETLAAHLTVGETYFFREKPSFDLLEQSVLPELIRTRRQGDKILRIWSAGCCTGEEPYSIGMLLDRLIPDAADWSITILATDINVRSLEAATAGVFGEWSFRGIPAGIRERYFSPLRGGKMAISPRIRRMVTFAVLNLAEDTYPSLVNNTSAIDVVLCRNVLMYFTPDTVARAVDGFHRALVPNGWLLVAPSEASQVYFRHFTVVGLPEVIFYRKPAEPPAQLVDMPDFQAAPEEPHHRAELPRQEAVEVPNAPTADSPADLARRLANQGKLAEARDVCCRAISQDPLNPSYRFLRAMVEQEQGMLDDAMKSLEQALYLDQDFVMAHFALASLGKRLGRHAVSRRHFRSALDLLEGLEPEEPLPDSEGMAAGRLAEAIRCATAGEKQKR